MSDAQPSQEFEINLDRNLRPTDFHSFMATIKYANAVYNAQHYETEILTALTPFSELRQPEEFKAWCDIAGVSHETVMVRMNTRRPRYSQRSQWIQDNQNASVYNALMFAGFKESWRSSHQNYFHGSNAQAMADDDWMRIARFIELSDGLPVGSLQSSIRANWPSFSCTWPPNQYPNMQEIVQALAGNGQSGRIPSSDPSQTRPRDCADHEEGAFGWQNTQFGSRDDEIIMF